MDGLAEQLRRAASLALASQEWQANAQPGGWTGGPMVEWTAAPERLKAEIAVAMHCYREMWQAVAMVGASALLKRPRCQSGQVHEVDRP